VFASNASTSSPNESGYGMVDMYEPFYRSVDMDRVISELPMGTVLWDAFRASYNREYPKQNSEQKFMKMYHWFKDNGYLKDE